MGESGQALRCGGHVDMCVSKFPFGRRYAAAAAAAGGAGCWLLLLLLLPGPSKLTQKFHELIQMKSANSFCALKQAPLRPLLFSNPQDPTEPFNSPTRDRDVLK